MNLATRFPIDLIRPEFPALGAVDGRLPRIYFDNPAGTQVPARVAMAASRTFLEANANLGGTFRTSILAGERVQRARLAMARLLGADSEREIIFGPSMTALTFHMSRSIGRVLRPGDEIVVTRMDHDANIAPWLMLAEDCGCVIRWLDFNLETWRIDLQAFEETLSPRTRLLAITYASNLTGSINDIRAFVDVARRAGVMTYVDAVQYAPHGFIGVRDLGCDFLACSAYKVFGPHLGVLYGREEMLEPLAAYKVRPAKSALPWRFEQGTPQIELHAALEASVDYIEWLGALCSDEADPRSRIASAFAASAAWEAALMKLLLDGLQRIPGVSIVGIADASSLAFRLPTISFTHRDVKSSTIAKALADRNIFVWSGFNYSLETIRRLNIDEHDGVVRIGIAHYNTPLEVEQVLDVLDRLG